MINEVRFLVAIGIAIFSGVGVANGQDHGHLNAGVESQTAGSKLIFANGADFATNSLYVKTLTYTNGSKFAGYYQGNTTLTVLPATAAHAGPDPAAPLLGAYVFAQLVSLDGPAGGEFGFWEATATTPSYTIKSGESGGTNLWRLTEADGSPETDPYGHIHGRRWTLTKPGLYALGLRLLDLSTNGPDGGPLHAPSDILYTYVQADVNLVGVDADASQTRVRFATPLGTDWQLEASDSLSGTVTWTPLGDVVTGADVIREYLDDSPGAANRFYRLRGIVH